MADDTPNIPQKKQRKSPTHKLSPEKILDLIKMNPNLTTRQLGKLTDSDHTAIVKCLQRYGIKREYLDSFKENRADILAGIQETVASTFTEEDIKKASIRDRTILFGTLYDKERLERGLSVSNGLVIYANAVQLACEQPKGESKNEGKVIEVEASGT